MVSRRATVADLPINARLLIEVQYSRGVALETKAALLGPLTSVEENLFIRFLPFVQAKLNPAGMLMRAASYNGLQLMIHVRDTSRRDSLTLFAKNIEGLDPCA